MRGLVVVLVWEPGIRNLDVQVRVELWTEVRTLVIDPVDLLVYRGRNLLGACSSRVQHLSYDWSVNRIVLPG